MTVGRIPSVEGGIQPTIVDAKGDLIAAVAADSLNRLAVGSNDQVLVADSAASTGLAWKSYGAQVVAGKNAIINSAMEIAQRGTSFTNVNGYSVDRWYVNRNGAVAGCTASQSTDVPTGFQYSLKTQRVSGNTGTQAIDMYYGLESKDSYRFRSEAATLSFYAKVGANYSGGASGLTARILSGTATDAAPYSGSTTVATSTPALTTTWTRFTLTGTFGASITQAFIQFGWSPTGTAGADDSVFITGVQLEIGSTATPFSRAGGTIQGELAACQRYCFAVTSGATDRTTSQGAYYNSTTFVSTVAFPVTMRTVPSATIVSSTNYWIIYANNTTDTADTASFGGAGLNAGNLEITGNASGTTGHGGQLRTNNASASVILSAEL